MIRMYSPFAARIPLLTDAPLPLLYGWRITRAPAASAASRVPSPDPSSTTRISRHAPADDRAATTAPIASASLNAGMRTVVCSSEATSHRPDQLLDHAVPCDKAGAFERRGAEIRREPRFGHQFRQRLGECRRRR